MLWFLVFIVFLSEDCLGIDVYDSLSEEEIKIPAKMGRINVSVEIAGEWPTYVTQYCKKIHESWTCELDSYHLYFHLPGVPDYQLEKQSDWCLDRARSGKMEKRRGFFMASQPHDIYFNFLSGHWQNLMSHTGVFYMSKKKKKGMNLFDLDAATYCIQCIYPDLTHEQKASVAKIRYILRLHEDWSRSTYRLTVLDENDQELAHYDSMNERRR